MVDLITHLIVKAFGTLFVCAMGSYCMYITHGNTGVGWAILALFFIWNSSYSEKDSDNDEKED